MTAATEVYVPTDWLGAFTRVDAHGSTDYHLRGIGDYERTEYLIQLTDETVDLVVWRLDEWHDDLAESFSIGEEHFTTAVRRARDKAEYLNQLFWLDDQKKRRAH
jgi:hypothetical protein